MLNTPNKIISFLGCAVLALVVFIVIDCGNDRVKKDELESWKSIAKKETAQVKLWKDQEGRSRARANVAEADNKILAETYGEHFRRMQRELDIKDGRLRSATTVTTKTEGNVKVEVRDSLIYLDTTKVKARTFQFRDRWATINGYFWRDSVLVKYQFYDSLTIATSWMRKNIFAIRELRIDAISYNPHTTITGLRSLSVKEPRKSRIGIGPFVGVGINGRVAVGIGVQYSLIRF